MLEQPIALATPWDAGSCATLAGSRRDLEGGVAVLVDALPFGRFRRLERVDPARDHLATLGLVRTWGRLGRAPAGDRRQNPRAERRPHGRAR
jgi:hypothetical protein